LPLRLFISASLDFRAIVLQTACESSALAKELDVDRSEFCRNTARDLISCVAQIIITAKD
jgi:hypothetical protein